MGLLNMFTATIGVDPGSENTRIAYEGNVVFNETSTIAFDHASKNVIAVGNDTIGKNNIVKPTNNVIGDFQSFEYLIRGAIKKVIPKRILSPVLIIYIATPMNATPIALRAYRDSGEHAGGKDIYLLPQPIAAAIGLRLFNQKQNFILIDFSASRLEITCFIDQLPTYSTSCLIGTIKLKQILKNHFKRKHQLEVSDFEVDDLLHGLGKPYGSSSISLHGKSFDTANLKTVLHPYLTMLEEVFLEANDFLLENSQNNNINNIYFTGGGSTIKWISKEIIKSSNMNVHFSDHPSLDVTNGIIEVMKLDSKSLNEIIIQ